MLDLIETIDAIDSDFANHKPGEAWVCHEGKIYIYRQSKGTLRQFKAQLIYDFHRRNRGHYDHDLCVMGSYPLYVIV
jgi:hypothetical protein